MKVLKVFLIVALICGTYGCAGMNTTDERILSGGAIGTAAGIGAAESLAPPCFSGPPQGRRQEPWGAL